MEKWRTMAMRQGGIAILVGTTKGAFLISDGSDRQGWTVNGPFYDGWPINHIIGDPATGVLWAGGGGDWHGAGVWRSEDAGATWQVAKLTKGSDRRLGGQRSATRRHYELDRAAATIR